MVNVLSFSGSILGISDGHDAGVAAWVNQQLFAVTEERVVQVKHYRGIPRKGLESLASLSETWDAIAIAGRYRKARRHHELLKVLSASFDPLPRLFWVDHHFAHAASAYYTSGFPEALVLTLDGGGDGLSGWIGIGKGDELVELKGFPIFESLGELYTRVTEILGFKPMSDEGKTMALAAYAIPPFPPLSPSPRFPFNHSQWERQAETLAKERTPETNIHEEMHAFGSMNVDNAVSAPSSLSSSSSSFDFSSFSTPSFFHRLVSFRRELREQFAALLDWSSSEARFVSQLPPHQFHVEIKQIYGQFQQKSPFSQLSLSSLLSDPWNSHFFLDATMAWAIQSHLLRTVHQLLDQFIHETGISRLAVAGGIFANSLLNMSLEARPDLKDVWIFPAMGDAGLPLGAVLAIHRKMISLPHVFLGPPFNSAQISLTRPSDSFQVFKKKEKGGGKRGEERTSQKGISWSQLRGQLQSALLETQLVIGLAWDQAEFGPRALGHRSLLASPEQLEPPELNKRKQRRWFQPFAPVLPASNYASLLGEKNDELYQKWAEFYDLTVSLADPGISRNLQFMTSCRLLPEMAVLSRLNAYQQHEVFMSKPLLTRSPLGKLAHVDGTIRLQITTEGRLHELLLELEKAGHSSVLINTSFNLHGKPMVQFERDVHSSLSQGLVDLVVTSGNESL